VQTFPSPHSTASFRGDLPDPATTGASANAESSDRAWKEEKFVTRARALFFTRLAFLAIGLTVIAVPSWSFSLGIQGQGVFAVFFGMLGYSIVNFLVLQRPKGGRTLTFATLCFDLLVAVYLIESTGGLQSPLLATQLMFTVLFVLLFPKPLAILPPLLTLPVVAKLDQLLGLRVIDFGDLLILIWYSALNFIIVYVMVYLHEREEVAHSDIVALERDLQGLAVTEERNRLSREIHDGLGATLSSLIIQAEYIEGLASTPELKSEIQELKGCAEDSIDELRRALRMMRADFELVPAVEDYCRTFGNRSKLPVQFHRAGMARALRNEAQLTIFRVLQETLNNARKHAEASILRVELSFDERALRLVVADDGKGFDPKAPRRGHYGVTTMRERAAKVGGDVTIDSAPGQGTRITLEIPYAPIEARF
jgi:signal transduction histidine kinase